MNEIPYKQEKQANKGFISKQLTVWCGLCAQWEYIDNPRDARQKGWKKTKENGWICKQHNK